MNWNKAPYKGWTTSEPEVKVTPNGATLISISVAIKDDYKKDTDGKPYTSFLDLEYWPNAKVEGNVQAEIAKLRKGLPVLFFAKPMQERWDQDGQKRSRFKFVVDGWIEVLEHHKKDPSKPAPEAGQNPGDWGDDGDIPF